MAASSRFCSAEFLLFVRLFFLLLETTMATSSLDFLELAPEAEVDLEVEAPLLEERSSTLAPGPATAIRAITESVLSPLCTTTRSDGVEAMASGD